MTDFSALLVYDGHTDRWQKLRDGPRSSTLYCKTVIETAANGTPVYDDIPANYFCGGVLADAQGPVVFDVAGRAPPERLHAGGNLALPLINDPQDALVTAVTKTSLGLTVVRGNTTESSIQFLSQGHWEMFRPSFKTIRIFALGSLDDHTLLTAGASGTLSELIDGVPCDDPIQSLSPDSIGKLTVTEHFLVYTGGESSVALDHTIYAARIR
jgi:hypothetical protein